MVRARLWESTFSRPRSPLDAVRYRTPPSGPPASAGLAVMSRKPGAEKGSAEWRARVSKGTKRGIARRIARPAHVDEWLRGGRVAIQLVPFVKARSEQATQMVLDLGGPENVTAMERAVIEGWLRLMVAADGEFRRYIHDDDAGALDRLAPLLNGARAHISTIGLGRRPKDVTLDLKTYLAEREEAGS